MKVALVSPYDYPYPGGVTEHIRQLYSHLGAEGHEVRLARTVSRAEVIYTRLRPF